MTQKVTAFWGELFYIVVRDGYIEYCVTAVVPV